MQSMPPSAPNSTRQQPFDPLLVKALSYARTHTPCLISCRTLVAVDMAAAYLRSQGHTVETITAATRNEDYRRVIEAYDSGRANYVVVTAAMALMGAFSLSRPGFITASHYMNGGYARQLRSRMKSPPDSDHNLDVEEPECSPPL